MGCAPTQEHRTKVWIIGDSYIRRAAERATQTMGNSLGVDGIYVHWFGWGGLRWKNLLPFFYQSLRGRAVPDVLLIHCGGNDLGDVTSVNLVAAMKEDLHHLHLQYPDMKIIFSGITQRCRWKAGASPAKIDKAYSVFSASVSNKENTSVDTVAEHAPCWLVEEFVLLAECTLCSDFQTRTWSECSATGYVERVNCTKSLKDEYKSCRSTRMEEQRFWKFEGTMLTLTVIFAFLVMSRQRALDRLVSEKVRKQIESI